MVEPSRFDSPVSRLRDREKSFFFIFHVQPFNCSLCTEFSAVKAADFRLGKKKKRKENQHNRGGKDQ